MKLTPLYIVAVLLCGLLATAADAARIEVRRSDGQSQFSVELGQIVDMEIIIDAEGEELTGYSIFLSYDADVFSLVPAEIDAEGGVIPFDGGGFLRGIPLVNAVEQIEDKIFLSYVEAAGGAARRTATGRGIVARFQLEAVRRSQAESVFIAVEERGHDRVSHYVTVAAPGIEQRFAEPLGAAEVRVTGFRILPLPDLTVIEGESQLVMLGEGSSARVFDLDDFVDTLSTEVLWTNSRLSEIPTEIDAETREVTMSPRAGFVGRRAMIFTAFEVGEGLTAADTISILVLSRPRIENFPDTVRFAEDTINQDLDFDAFATDVDHAPGDLVWTAGDSPNVTVEINDASHVATFRASADYFGVQEISFIVTDPTALADTISAIIEVTPVNDPPEALSPPPVYPVEGEGPVAIPLAQIFSDRDDNVAELQVFLEVEGGVRAEIVDGNLLVSGSQSGRGIVHITVQDTSGASADSRQVAVVLGPGESVPPEIATLPELRFPGGQTGALDLNELVMDDSSAAALIWSVEADSGLVASVTNGQLQVSGESGFSGSAYVTLTVTDAQGNSDSARQLVSILRPEDDFGPRLTPLGKIGLRQDEVVEIELDKLVADPDHNDNEISWTFFPTAGVETTFDAETRVLSVRAGADFAKPASLGLIARDPQGGQAEAEVPVLLALPGGPPQLVDFPTVSLDSLSSQVELDLDDFAFDDLDRESELLWEIEAEPGVEVSFDPVTHDLTLKRDPSITTPPLVTQILLRVTDTQGQERTALVTVGLPPLFELLPLPDVEIFAGRIDSSIVLQDFAIGSGGSAAPALIWRVDNNENIRADIDAQSTLLRLQLATAGFTGAELLRLTATDATGRQRETALRVVVKGLGLAPQIRTLPRVEVEEGQIDTSVDLDDFVVDDDADDLLQWVVSGQRAIGVEIDPETRIVTLDATAVPPTLEQLQFAVRDPAGNTALAIMMVVVLRGGAAPEIASLPQILLTAGEQESQLNLSAFANDPDTPAADLTWEVEAEPGIAARIEGDRLFIAVPADQSGNRVLKLTATDPQGNVASADLEILIQQDTIPPEFTVEVNRHPIFSELVELSFSADEELSAVPTVRIDGDSLSVDAQEDGSYRAAFAHMPQLGERFVQVELLGTDRGGNEGRRAFVVSLAWMDEMGGNVRSPDPQLMLNVADAAARPGQMAIVYRLGAAETPPGSEGEPVYSLDLLRGRMLGHPVTVNFLPGASADPQLGILRWDKEAEVWEELSTTVDAQNGWLSTTVDELGLFRTGRIAAENRRESLPLNGYPNPFVATGGRAARIDYRLDSPGKVRLQIYNSLGQPVRLLVEQFQEVGVWSVGWNGLDDEGRRQGSGVYFYELFAGGRQHRRSLVLVR